MWKCFLLLYLRPRIIAYTPRSASGRAGALPAGTAGRDGHTRSHAFSRQSVQSTGRGAAFRRLWLVPWLVFRVCPPWKDTRNTRKRPIESKELDRLALV